MIKIKIRDEDGVIFMEGNVDPHEALKALEEQAPEVLRELVMSYFRDVFAELCKKEASACDNFYKARKVFRQGLLSNNEQMMAYYDGLGDAYNDACSRLAKLNFNVSPWIKVSDQEPPKDGSCFLWRLAANKRPLMVTWSLIEERWTYDNNRVHILDVDKRGEWMPIPK